MPWAGASSGTHLPSLSSLPFGHSAAGFFLGSSEDDAALGGSLEAFGCALEALGASLEAAGGYKYPASQTPWQEMQRAVIGQMETGMVLEPAVKYQRIAQTRGIPRNNH